MPKHVHPSDVREASRLASTAVAGLTDLVEALHATISAGPGALAGPLPASTRGLTGLVYRGVREATRAAGSGADALLGRLVPLLEVPGSTPERDAVLAALNGVLGDRLVAEASPLATPMGLRHDGRPLVLEPGPLREAVPDARSWILVLVHGLCMNERAWDRAGTAAAAPFASLAAELGATGLRLRYNSGLHVSRNGRALADRLEALAASWPVPVERLSIVAHSMGGLVARSAVHHGRAAGHAWSRALRDLVFLGTPHHGAPLERIGNVAQAVLTGTPWSAPFARLGRLRSAGITDLRHGNLLDEDWEGRDRFGQRPDDRAVVPLPAGVRAFAIAGSLGPRPAEAARALRSDGLVPVESALGHHAEPARSLPIPDGRRRVVFETGHLDLLSSPGVAAPVADWLRG